MFWLRFWLLRVALSPAALTGDQRKARKCFKRTNGCENGAKSGAMDHVKQCQFPSYSRKLGFTKKKCLIDTGFAPPQGRVWPQSGNQVKSTSVFSHVLTACDISRVFLAWLGTSICTSAHFFPRSSSVLRRSV